MYKLICRLSNLPLLALMLWVAIGSQPPSANAGEPSVDRVLGLDQPDCCHVIELLVRNRARRFAGHAAPAHPDVLGAPLPGDLELVDVQLVCEADNGQGPVYQVRFRNTSRWAVRDFRISVVGVLERITPDAPCRSIRIGCIDAGETRCVEIELPTRCLAMSCYGGPEAPFDTLIVALDSLDELVECDELNNVAIIKRVDIALLTAETVETTVTPGPDNPLPNDPLPNDSPPNDSPPNDSPPNDSPPNDSPPSNSPPNGAAPGIGGVPESTPGDKAKPSPLDDIDLDKLDLGNGQDTAVKISTRR